MFDIYYFKEIKMEISSKLNMNNFLFKEVNITYLKYKLGD
jgi:hypothetical protein